VIKTYPKSLSIRCRLTVVKPAGGAPVTFTYNAEGKRMKKEA
jgi:YD repeat-containing protein